MYLVHAPSGWVTQVLVFLGIPQRVPTLGGGDSLCTHQKWDVCWRSQDVIYGNILGRSQGYQGEMTTARSQSIQPVFCHVLSQVLQQCTRVLSENCEKYADLLERCAPVTLLWDGSARRFSYKKWWFSIAILNYQAMHGTNSAIYTVLLVILTISLEALVKFSIFTFLKDIRCTILDVKYYNLLQFVTCASMAC